MRTAANASMAAIHGAEPVRRALDTPTSRTPAVISEKTVETRLYRARAKLKAMIGDQI